MKKLLKVFGIFIMTILIFTIIASISTKDPDSAKMMVIVMMVGWLIFRDIYKHYYDEKSD
ncbi:MAG: hypothetical protein KAR20_25920 [Candidatus Heimdallarchaeota archaeon]|nr:hypothetical protein [Candidatus Heimdallarchaeota archaeon]